MISIKLNIKQILKTFPILVKIKRLIWKLLKISSLAPSPAEKNYFSTLFSNHSNAKSISFEKGIVEGSFRGTSFLLKIRPQNLIESYVFLNGMWEPHIVELIASYLKAPNTAVIDVGANIGATSIPIAKHFTESKFFLFEPHPIIYEDLINNISYNKLSNIEAYNIAITNSDDLFLPFFAQMNAKNFGLSSFTLNHDIEDYEVIQVECKSLDSIINEDLQIKVIKIDTQGHELNVLLSAKQLIFRHRPIVFFEFESEYFQEGNNEAETKEHLLQLFDQLNYELYMIGNDCKFFPKLTLQGYFKGDILAVPLHNG
jgi:FkbM family methyltransferase